VPLWLRWRQPSEAPRSKRLKREFFRGRLARKIAERETADMPDDPKPDPVEVILLLRPGTIVDVPKVIVTTPEDDSGEPDPDA